MRFLAFTDLFLLLGVLCLFVGFDQNTTIHPSAIARRRQSQAELRSPGKLRLTPPFVEFAALLRSHPQPLCVIECSQLQMPLHWRGVLGRFGSEQEEQLVRSRYSFQSNLNVLA
jgi:hypothetical protein